MTTDTEQRWFGRIDVPDERDGRFPLATPDLPTVEELLEATRPWLYMSRGWRGNQGPTPQCVAYMTLHIWEQLGRPGDPDPWDPEYVYGWCQRNDQWTGTDYAGTSERAGLAFLAEQGVIGEYRWARSAEEVARGMLARRMPAAIGTPWFRSMNVPDDDGWLHVEGDSTDLGHALMASGVHLLERKFRWDNSWGPTWGDDGRAWVHFDTVDDLIARGARIAVPTRA